MRAWTERCAERLKAPVELRYCPPGRVVLSLPRADLDIELRSGPGPALRKEGNLGISPVGEFPEWKDESPARRDALEGVVECVRVDPGLDPDAADGALDLSPPLPWRLLAGALCGALLAAGALRRVGRKRVALGIAVALATMAGLLALRVGMLGFAFFHQNGHGPRWVETALGTGEGDSIYGPGFYEVFAMAARAAGRQPEHGVFWLQAVLGAAVPCFAYCAARRVGAGWRLAAAVALAIAMDPLLARMSLSESYFATMLCCNFAAVAALTLGARAPRITPAFWLGVVAAGLCIAQGARVHPLGWVPSALVPVVVLLGPGSPRRRALLTLLAGVGIAVVVAVSAGPALLDVLHGRLGRQWMPSTGFRLAEVLRGGLTPYFAALAIAAIVIRHVRAWLAAGIAALALALPAATDMLSAPNEAIDAAVYRQTWPVLAAAVASLLSIAPRRFPRALRQRARSVVAGLVLAVGLASAAWRFRPLTQLPTDALEQRWAAEWRRNLPAEASLAFVERADKRAVSLPVYAPSVQLLPLATERPPMNFREHPGVLFYYRSSVCSSADARAYCDAVERELALDLVAERYLPARPSMRWSPYDTHSVRVALYRRR